LAPATFSHWPPSARAQARYSPRAFVSRTSVENDTALEVVFAITDSRQRREVSRPFRERLRISLI
jgi:hypothetical protein